MDRPTLRPPGDLRPGVRLDVRDDGPPDGEPVLLLHGFPQDGTSWSGLGNSSGSAELYAVCASSDSTATATLSETST